MSSLLLDSKYNNHEYLKKIKIYGYFSCLHPSWTCKDSGADGSCYLALIGLVSNPSIYYLWLGSPRSYDLKTLCILMCLKFDKMYCAPPLMPSHTSVLNDRYTCRQRRIQGGSPGCPDTPLPADHE